jgi:hypothetical protein
LRVHDRIIADLSEGPVGNHGGDGTLSGVGIFDGWGGASVFSENVDQATSRKRGFVQSFKASLFGVPLPVCSCGIIPLAKELKKSGASNAGVSAFLASTPQTGVDSVIATDSLLGSAFRASGACGSFWNSAAGI